MPFSHQQDLPLRSFISPSSPSSKNMRSYLFTAFMYEKKNKIYKYSLDKPPSRVYNILIIRFIMSIFIRGARICFIAAKKNCLI